jgi:hypothetical protein
MRYRQSIRLAETEWAVLSLQVRCKMTEGSLASTQLRVFVSFRVEAERRVAKQLNFTYVLLDSDQRIAVPPFLELAYPFSCLASVFVPVLGQVSSDVISTLAGHTTMTCPYRTAPEHGSTPAIRRQSGGMVDVVRNAQISGRRQEVRLV